jgi:hypothetical protein
MDREWTDKRMDDFATGVDRRFDQVDKRFDRFEASVDRRFDQADALEKERFAAVHAELAVVSKKTDKVIWILISGFGSILATTVGAVVIKVFLG